jgi:hypothetical protein
LEGIYHAGEGEQGRGDQAMKIEKHGSIVIPELEAAAKEPGHSKGWTEEEENTMRKYYKRLSANGSVKELARYLERPSGSIYSKARSMGLQK